MGIKFDWNAAPENMRHFKQHRILFLSAMAIFVLNLILSGIFITPNTLLFIIVALIFAAFTVYQCFDLRSEMWTWGYILAWIAFSFVASAVIFLAYKAYLWFIAYFIELALYMLLYKKVFKRRSTRPNPRQPRS